MAKKTILETLVTKFNKTPQWISRVDRNIEITPEEAEWAEEHQDELMKAFEEAARKRHMRYNCCPYLKVSGDMIEVAMEA